MKKLLIVESPRKATCIQNMLGTGWIVIASKGHICDLPSNDIGIDRTTLTPTYAPTDKGKRAIAAIKAKMTGIAPTDIYLATDPDREGEAIAGHLAATLKLKHPKRVTYNEINEPAIRAAIANPRQIDHHLVAAQNLRRCEDRLFGYILSGPLAQHLNANRIGIGRVQAAALALIAEREHKIANHRAIEHFTATLDFTGWTAKWQIPKTPRPKSSEPDNATLDLDTHADYCTDQHRAALAAACRTLTVGNYTAETVSRLPPPPLVTASLIATAGKLWDYDPDIIMQAAQKLYEGEGADAHGYITYHRTDVPTVSQSKADVIRDFAARNGLPIPATPNKHKGKNANAQEGHEAILPTNIEDAGTAITDPIQRNLYILIRSRALISQLAPATYDRQIIDLTADNPDPATTGPYTFRATGQRLTYAGFLAAAGTLNIDDIGTDPDNANDEPAAETTLPVLTAGQRIQAATGNVHTHQTSAPPRYTQATILAKMEHLSIGRPSTYAALFTKIKEHGYVTTNGKKQFAATPLGLAAYAWIYPRFRFAWLSYTQKQEALYDQIATGQAPEDPRKTLADVWTELDVGLANTPTIPHESRPCPKCTKPMRRITGKRGAFWSCSGYQDKSCTHTESA